MVSFALRRLRRAGRSPIIAIIVAVLLLTVAAMGQRMPTVKPAFAAAAVLLLLGAIVVVGRPEAGILVLAGLSMYRNPTLFDVQGRQIQLIHLVGGLITLNWLLRRLLVQRDLRLPRSRLNPPLLALALVWPVAWLAGYAFWDAWVPTTHRQPLFFVAEYGQLLMLIGVFWAVAETVTSERWTKAICITIITVNATTFLVMGLPQDVTQGAWNQLPVALALACAWLAYGEISLPTRIGLWGVLGLLLLGTIQVNRIPVYLASLFVMLGIALLRSRRLFILLLLASAILAVPFVVPLWRAEGSVLSRLELARLAMTVFRDHPILGIGPTHYRSYALLYHRGVSYGWDTVESGFLLPHNRWLYFLAGTGIVGAAAVFWLVGSVAWEALSTFRRALNPLDRALAAAALACTGGVVVQSIGGHMAFLPDYDLASFYMVPIWILFGLMVARRRMAGADATA